MAQVAARAADVSAAQQAAAAAQAGLAAALLRVEAAEAEAAEAASRAAADAEQQQQQQALAEEEQLRWVAELAEADAARAAAATEHAALTAELSELRESQQVLQRSLEAAQQQATAAAAQQTATGGQPDANGAAVGSSSPEGAGRLEALQARLSVERSKAASLEKANKELSWQVAMLARSDASAGLGVCGPPGSVSVAIRGGEAGGAPGPQASVAWMVGWVLRYRRQLLGLYLVLIHAVLYLVLLRAGDPTKALGGAGAGAAADGSGAASSLLVEEAAKKNL